MPLSAGTRLGPYEVLSPIGAGGMGEVYRALDTRLGRQVALKVLPEGLALEPVRLRRFEQEARAASALNHPNILTLLNVGSPQGTPYLVTELLEGRNLRAVIGGARRPPARVLDYAAQIARGLAAADHRRDGIIGGTEAYASACRPATRSVSPRACARRAPWRASPRRPR